VVPGKNGRPFPAGLFFLFFEKKKMPLSEKTGRTGTFLLVFLGFMGLFGVFSRPAGSVGRQGRFFTPHILHDTDSRSPVFFLVFFKKLIVNKIKSEQPPFFQPVCFLTDYP
jgi:hypothetical protein